MLTIKYNGNFIDTHSAYPGIVPGPPRNAHIPAWMLGMNEMVSLMCYRGRYLNLNALGSLLRTVVRACLVQLYHTSKDLVFKKLIGGHQQPGWLKLKELSFKARIFFALLTQNSKREL